MGALEVPQDRQRTGTQDGDLQSGTDNSEAMAELAALEAMAVQGASGGHGVARGSGGHGSAGSSGGHGRWSLWPWPRSPRPGPYSRNPFTPPKISWGSLGGIRSPPGLDTDKQDRTSHRNRFHLHDKGAGG